MTRTMAVRAGAAVLMALGAVGVTWGPGATVASACDCQGPATDAAAIELSDAAFTGTLVGRIDPDPLVTSADPVRYVFDVELVHKGEVGARVEVESAWSGASCGATIAADQPMFVVARVEGDRLTTAQCSGTRPVAEPRGGPLIGGHAPSTSPTIEPSPAPMTDELAAHGARGTCGESDARCVDTVSTGSSAWVVALAAGAVLAGAGIAAWWLMGRRASSADR